MKSTAKQKVEHEITIYGSRLQSFIICCIILACCYLPLERLALDASNNQQRDEIMLAVLAVAVFYFLFKAVNPTRRIHLSKQGIWTKKSGMQKWRAIDDISLAKENSVNQHGHKKTTTYLVVALNDATGLREKERTVRFRVSDLNKSAAELEHIILAFKQRYFDNHGVEIGNAMTQQQKKAPERKKGETPESIFKFRLLISCLVMAVGGYCFYNSSKTKEDYDGVSGKVSYIDTYFHKYHNLDTRFIQLEGDPTVFQVFVGNGKGDFGPELEKLGTVRPGDRITLYGGDAEKEFGQAWYINQNVAFIEKGNKLVYAHDKASNAVIAKVLIPVGIAGLLLSGFAYFRKKRRRYPPHGVYTSRIQ